MGVYLIDAQRGVGPSEIGHQALVPRHVLTGQHGDVADARAARQTRLDLAQLDTETTDFHLVVVTPKAFEQAVHRPTPKITRAVHQGVGLFGKRVVHELFGAQVRAVQIALGHAIAANADFASDAQGHRLQLRVQHIDLRIGNGPPHRHALHVIGKCAHFVGGGVGGGFGRAIAMHQAQCRCLGQQAAEGGRVGALAAAQQNAQAGQCLGDQLHILVEQRGGDEQHRGTRQLGAECLRVEQGSVVDYLHLPTVEQRAPYIHGARVERRVRRKGHAVLGIEVGVAVIDHQPGNAALGHQYAFGRAGGAGGVHDVGHAVGGLFPLGIVGRQPVEVQPGQVVQHQAGAAVLHHEGLAFGRRIDVQRHVHRRALEHGHLADHQVDAARQRQGHRLARLHALADQVVGQAIGAAIEVAVTQGQLALHHRHRFRPCQRLGFEQLCNAQMRRVIAATGVELHQQLLALYRRYDRQRLQRGGRRLLQGRHQVAQRGQHVVRHALHVQRGDALHGEGKACAQIIDVEHQRVVAALFGAEYLDAGRGERAVTRRFIRCAVAIVEQGTEQRQRRRHATAALGQRQRGMFVPEQLRQACVGGAHTGLHARGAEADPQRQGVDEHPQRPIGALAALHAPQQHGAEHHVALAGHLAQHLRPGQVHQARGTHAQLPRLFAQGQAQPRLQRQMGFDDAAAVAIHILQAEGQGRLVDIAEHLAEESFVLRLTHTEARLGHVVAVLHRVGQLRAAAAQAGTHLLHQHVQGGVVEQDMVQQQDADQAPRFLAVRQAHQRRA
ncbi:hypothetical protein [Pseudomonas sp. 24 E 13]|nr:hypothetical protein [Pseudomonas sp. 24 E 13]